MTIGLVWLRQDLRLHDNPALLAAIEDNKHVVLAYIYDARPDWAYGGASQWWLHYSLTALNEAIQTRGGTLILRKGAAYNTLTTLMHETKADHLYYNRSYNPADRALETDLKDALPVKDHPGNLLLEPWLNLKDDGTPYQVFTPYWKNLQKKPIAAPLPAPLDLPTPNDVPASDSLDDWQLLPTKPDWTGGLREIWQPGEIGAQDRLYRFFDGALQGYGENRNRPDFHSTSELSPHLQFGEISPRQIYAATNAYIEHKKGLDKDAAKFLSEVGWREFSYNLLYHYPDLPHSNLRKNFDNFPWHDNTAWLERWQQGQTGYPIVDAGMRQLWHTGWMHNRVRMICASFLVKHLRIHWRDGAAWFWDTLVDADLANNSASWQWVAGCGADAAPYFRIFNPITQGEKFDPKGDYIRQWVPELANLQGKGLYAPWTVDEKNLTAAKITLGKSYPQPIVDHMQARDAALEAFEKIKNK